MNKMNAQLEGKLIPSVLTFPKALEIWEKKTTFYNPKNIEGELGHGCGGTVYSYKGGSCVKVMYDVEDEERCAELAEEFNFLCLVWYSAPQNGRKPFIEPLFLEIYQNSLVIGLERFEGTTLKEILGKGLHCQLNLEIALDLCETMGHLNDLSIFHADFGVHNVMVSSDFSRLRVIDFGFAYHLNEPRKYSSVYEYKAPEELDNKGIRSPQEMKKMQIWNMGMLLLSVKFNIRRYDFGEGEEDLSPHHLKKYVESFQLTDESPVDRIIKAALAENPDERIILDIQ
ncbi:serine/threonine protein kinase [Tunisvirus fontaine2]|uniref:Serine/threonine protein kinase n=1 Tax=Tunisvirus fontaine2 TaxID=1421067 RepID=V9SG71_9VIRU|nr:serine/threonine protein kinase [Tunisvirus fontaine2]AHC54752.1 serine/threonine protein kinase [Tunisvirus fontaine2]